MTTRSIKSTSHRASIVDGVTTSLRHLLPALKAMNSSTRPLSLHEVGRLAQLSPGRVQRVFSNLVGESPDRYQWRVRLDRAGDLLAATDTTVTDIAFAVGFGSHEAFSRAFHRRFATSPTKYRAMSRDASTVSVAHPSPCIGLYGQPLANHTEETTMDYDITTAQLDPTPVLYMARRADKDQIAGVLAECLPAVFQYVMAQGLPMAGPPYVRYTNHSAAFFEIEAGIPLAATPAAPAADTGILSGELPGGAAATTVHRGPYDTLGEAHVALDRWMEENGTPATGAPWEVYLTDPGEVPDPKDWETQILWPI